MQSSLKQLLMQVTARVQRSWDGEGLDRSHAGEKGLEGGMALLSPPLHWGLRNYSINIIRICLFVTISVVNHPRDVRDDYSATPWYL